MRRLGCIGVYGAKTRALQRCLSYEAFGLTFKLAKVFRYLGDKNNTTDQNINNIGSYTFMEVPDRAYDTTTVQVPIAVERRADQKADYSRYGFIDPIANETILKMHIDDFEPLGRNLIIGDVLEIPFFKTNDGNNSFWSVDDVNIDDEETFLATIYVSPLGEDRRTNEIPIDSGTDSILDDISDGMEREQSEIVPSTDETYDGNPPEDEVDYRDQDQRSFLDNPNQPL